MVAEQKRAKTESLSLRLDPKTKFILDFVARINGQSITTVVERAIKSASENHTIGSKWDEHGRELEQKNWINFWDPSEGVRTLRLISDPDYPTNFEEDELRAFTVAHWPFFYLDPNGYRPHRAYTEILWPEISKYLSIWRNEKTQDYWSAGRAMTQALTEAQVAPPDWPPKKKNSPLARDDLDEEIPF